MALKIKLCHKLQPRPLSDTLIQPEQTLDTVAGFSFSNFCSILKPSQPAALLLNLASTEVDPCLISSTETFESLPVACSIPTIETWLIVFSYGQAWSMDWPNHWFKYLSPVFNSTETLAWHRLGHLGNFPTTMDAEMTSMNFFDVACVISEYICGQGSSSGSDLAISSLNPAQMNGPFK